MNELLTTRPWSAYRYQLYLLSLDTPKNVVIAVRQPENGCIYIHIYMCVYVCLQHLECMNTTQMRRGYVTPDTVTTLHNLQRANYDAAADFVRAAQYLIEENQKQHGLNGMEPCRPGIDFWTSLYYYHGPWQVPWAQVPHTPFPGHGTPFNQAQPTRNPLSLSQFLISQGGIHGSNVDAEMLTSSKQACHVTTMHAADSFCTPSLPMFVMQQNLCPLARSETRCGECMHLSV